MYCYFKGEVDFCCDSCDNCEHYEGNRETNNTNINDDESDIEDNIDNEEDEIKSDVIATAKYTYQIDEHNYSKLICWFADGTEKTFHFCANNPMPKLYVVEGLTWEQLQGMCMGMWRMAIGEFVKISK